MVHNNGVTANETLNRASLMLVAPWRLDSKGDETHGAQEGPNWAALRAGHRAAAASLICHGRFSRMVTFL